jgi:hypothetical protein
MAQILDKHIQGAIAWQAKTTVANDGLVVLTADCLAELHAAAAFLQSNPLPTTALDLADFELAHMRELMQVVKAQLDHGIGFAILEKFPWAQYDTSICKGLHWLVMSLLGRTVAQKWNGEMVYDVLDTGNKEAIGAGVRGSKTNSRQGYHTDNSYNLPPDYVGLTCLNTAKEGGLSGLVSFASAHNLLLDRFPEHLARLYEPFLFERYNEFSPGESAISALPIFAFDGSNLAVRLSTGRIRMGYEAAGEPLDSKTNDALAALDEVLEDPELGKTFEFLPGQTQIVNNRKIGHRRTAFIDWPEPEKRRHLVRLWVRNHGRRFYAG